MKKIVISLLALALVALPVVASAQIIGGPRPDFNYANDWVIQLLSWARTAITFLMVLATLYFIWTVIGYIRVKDAKESEEKKKAMLRGIIGLFVMVGIWGIVRILSNTLGVSGGSLAPQNTPCPPGMQYSDRDRACI